MSSLTTKVKSSTFSVADVVIKALVKDALENHCTFSLSPHAELQAAYAATNSNAEMKVEPLNEDGLSNYSYQVSFASSDKSHVLPTIYAKFTFHKERCLLVVPRYGMLYASKPTFDNSTSLALETMTQSKPAGELHHRHSSTFMSFKSIGRDSFGLPSIHGSMCRMSIQSSGCSSNSMNVTP